MMKKNYKMKKTISMKQFIEELGKDFSPHMKERLLELGARCLLNRREESHILDLRHIEHIKYDCCCGLEGEEAKGKKEYAYGQLVVKGGELFFSQSCIENEDIMQIPLVREVYHSLSGQEVLADDQMMVKKVDDSNIDYVIDSILNVCPEVSPEHLAIIAKYNTTDNSRSAAKRY